MEFGPSSSFVVIQGCDADLLPVHDHLFFPQIVACVWGKVGILSAEKIRLEKDTTVQFNNRDRAFFFFFFLVCHHIFVSAMFK